MATLAVFLLEEDMIMWVCNFYNLHRDIELLDLCGVAQSLKLGSWKLIACCTKSRLLVRPSPECDLGLGTGLLIREGVRTTLHRNADIFGVHLCIVSKNGIVIKRLSYKLNDFVTSMLLFYYLEKAWTSTGMLKYNPQRWRLLKGKSCWRLPTNQCVHIEKQRITS